MNSNRQAHRHLEYNQAQKITLESNSINKDRLLGYYINCEGEKSLSAQLAISIDSRGAVTENTYECSSILINFSFVRVEFRTHEDTSYYQCLKDELGTKHLRKVILGYETNGTRMRSHSGSKTEIMCCHLMDEVTYKQSMVPKLHLRKRL